MSNPTREELQKLGYLGSLITPPQVGNVLMVMLNVAAIILSWLSVTLEVFIRRNFGERYLNLLRLFLALQVMATFRFFYNAIQAFKGRGNLLSLFWNPAGLNALFYGDTSSRVYFLFWWAYVVVAALHIIAIKRREHQGIEWHSMSFGQSWLEELPLWGLWNWLVSWLPWRLGAFLNVDEWVMYCVLEPLLCYLASFSVYRLDSLLGTWLWLAAWALFFKNLLVYYELRGRMLDLMDASIESRFLSAALRGESKGQTAGFSVVTVPVKFAEVSENIDLAAVVQETLKPTATAQ